MAKILLLLFYVLRNYLIKLLWTIEALDMMLFQPEDTSIAKNQISKTCERKIVFLSYTSA